MKRLRPYVLAAVAFALFLAIMSHGLRLRAEADTRKNGGNRMLYAAFMARVHARDHAGSYPPVSHTGKRLIFDLTALRNGYELAGRTWGTMDNTEHGLLLGVLNNHPAWELRSYWKTMPDFFYLGYMCSNEAEAMAFLDVYSAQIHGGTPFDIDLPATGGTGSFGTDRFIRLREDNAAPGRLPPDIANVPSEFASRVPLVIEDPGHYERPGGWVIYLNRHAEFLPYPGPFPMSEAFISRLRALRDARPLK